MATNDIALFCIDNRLRQMAFFLLTKWAKAGFRVMLKDFETKKPFSVVVQFFLYYIKQIDSMLPCVCSVMTQSAIASCATSLFLTHFELTSSVIYY